MNHCIRLTLAFAAVAMLCPVFCLGIVSSNGGANAPYSGININNFVGADTFYSLGYTGSRAVIANVEAGSIWNGHETLGHITTFFDDPATPPPNGDFDRHATFVGSVLGGRPGGTNPGEYQRGIAYGAEIWSGSTARVWTGTPFTLTFNTTPSSIQTPYYMAMVGGVGGRTADVVTSSWSNASFRDNSSIFGRVFDALVDQSGKTMVTVASNEGDTAIPRVNAPGANFNNITVASLTSDTSPLPYSTRTSTSSYGPNDFWNPTGGGSVVPNVVAAVDLAAPGTNLTLAFYGGTTGGNTGGTATPGNNLYTPNREGTSFAAPIVAGGAALLVDVGHAMFDGGGGGGYFADGRVIKSVLQNSAAKTTGWNNGQSNVGGVITTTQSLDYFVGAGRINLAQAYTQYTAGTNDLSGFGGGTVEPIGWDFGQVAQGSPTDYFFSTPLPAGTLLTTTLDWFIDNTYSLPTLGVHDDSLDNLDLEIWKVLDGTPTMLVAQSDSIYNNVEHLSFVVPDAGEYMIRVKWTGEVFDTIADANVEQFGLAWSAVPVPEPAPLSLTALALTFAACRRAKLTATSRPPSRCG